MCLIVSKSCYEILTAKKDITVYKVLYYTLEEDFYTPYTKHYVIFDEVIQAEGELQLESDDTIVKVSGGMFHSYTTYFKALCLAKSYKNMCI